MIAVALAFMSIVWYTRVRLHSYFPFSVYRFVLSSLVLVIAGLALELPLLIARLKQKGRITVDWLTLLIFGSLPFLMASCIPLSYFGIPVPPLICLERLQYQIGAFWLGVAIGKSITVKGSS